MKIRFGQTLVILVFALSLLAACTPSSTPTAQPVSPTLPAYPDPAQIQAQRADSYPGPNEGVSNFTTWADLETAVMAGKAAQAYLDTAGHVRLVLKDNTVMLALGPSPDAFTQLITQCGAPCKDIKINQQ